jgi:hypothetical protein
VVPVVAPSRLSTEGWQVVTRCRQWRRVAQRPPPPAPHRSVPIDLVGRCFNCLHSDHTAVACTFVLHCLCYHEEGHRAPICKRPRSPDSAGTPPRQQRVGGSTSTIDPVGHPWPPLPPIGGGASSRPLPVVREPVGISWPGQETEPLAASRLGPLPDKQAPASLQSATRAAVAEVREFEFEFDLLLLDRFPSSLLRCWDPMEDESTITLGALPQPKAPSRVWGPMALEVTLTADLSEGLVRASRRWSFLCAGQL